MDLNQVSLKFLDIRKLKYTFCSFKENRGNIEIYIAKKKNKAQIFVDQ